MGGKKAQICRIADHAIKRGIYVIIDWHDHHAHKNVREAKVFFAEMARRYAGTPQVIYEIWNEPEQVSWSLVKSYALEIIAAIRKYDRRNLIVVGSPNWDQAVDLVAEDPIQHFSNIAYSFHFYASDPHHQEALRLKAEVALSKGIPLFVTEWGVGESDGNGVFDKRRTRAWMDWMESRQLSWANWNITDKDETTALLRPGAAVNGKWQRNQLTPSGNYIHDQLRALNKDLSR